MLESVTEVPVKISKLKRLQIDSFDEKRDSSYCLLQVIQLESEDQELIEKRDELVQARIANVSRGVVQLVCNTRGCNIKITRGFEIGSKEQTGQCRVANYCLKQCFEDRNSTDKTPEARKADYEDIMKTCEGFAGKHSAGNFCPKLDCDLSAGFSIDGVAGTAGECLVEKHENQFTFDI